MGAERNKWLAGRVSPVGKRLAAGGADTGASAITFIRFCFHEPHKRKREEKRIRGARYRISLVSIILDECVPDQT